MEALKTRALVIGYGSIGQRHARILKEQGGEVAVLSRRRIDMEPHFYELSSAIADWQPDYVVVANETHEHLQILNELANLDYRGTVLVEKPIFDKPAEVPNNQFSFLGVGYNLRFHPLLEKLNNLLVDAGKIFTATIYVGSYLPNWRPDRDYRECYSAKRNEGGGVLLDLSHELDYIYWLLGPWQAMAAIGGHISDLDIDADDAYCLMMKTEKCPLVSVHLNFLDRKPRRSIIVNCQHHTYEVDLVNGRMTIDGGEENVIVDKDDTYRKEHSRILGLNKNGVCTADEALETLKAVASAKLASRDLIWVQR